MGLELATATIPDSKCDALPMRPSRHAEWEIFQINYSHTLLIPEIEVVQETKFIRHIFPDFFGPTDFLSDLHIVKNQICVYMTVISYNDAVVDSFF